MENLLDPLFDLHPKPLLLVQKDGLVKKANPAAAGLWPVLNTNTSCYLWQLDENQAQQARDFILSGEAKPERTLLLASGQGTAFHQLSLLNEGEAHFLLEATQPSFPAELTLPATAVLSSTLLEALLNSIPGQMLAVLDASMRYMAFNKAYQDEYARIFAISIAPGDHLLDTIQHMPGERQKARQLWEKILQGNVFSVTETFGHSSLGPTTYSLTFIPLKDQKGSFLGTLYIVNKLKLAELMQGQLPDAEKRFRTLAENTPDIVVRLDPNMRILYGNTSLIKEIGISPAALINKSIYEAPNISLIPEEYILKIKQALDTGQEQDLISPYHHQGVIKNYFTRFVPEKDETGTVVSVIAVSRNISDLQEAQQELLIARDFMFMADIIPQLLWITDADGNVSFFNQHWYEYTGLGKEESMFWGWQTVIHPDDLQNTLLEWQRCLENAEVYEVEYRLRRQDGSYRWFIGRAMPMKDTAGRVLKWYGFSADIHEHKQNRSELAERAQELQLLNQMIPQMVWSADNQGLADYFNQRWYQYTGLSIEQSIDRGWTRVLHPDDLQATSEAWTNSFVTGQPYQTECRFKRHDGVYRWFIARATPLRDHTNRIIKWFGTCTDIHNQKLQSEALARKNHELQQINAYLDRFVHTAAHDSRSPVANMKLLHDMLLREENQAKQKRLLDTFKPLLNRLDNTIIGLVEIVQMQEGHSALRVQEVDPREVLQLVKEELEDKLEEAHALLEENISLSKPLYYLKPYLLSMLRNLLSDAIKYANPEVPLKIRVTGEWRGKYYWLSVEDNGMGIDLPRNSKNLFRPFKRLTQKGEGLGIGLHMVQNMVQKNGGDIEVSSEPGKGSTFSLFLHPYED